jgi:putative intracellular protease/amidase
MDDSSVLLIIASEGFEQTEYHATKKAITAAGFSVITGSDKLGNATAKDGSHLPVEISLDKIDTNNYAGIFFIGGPNALEHLDTPTSYKIAQDAFYQNKPIGAICISTRILAKSGILNGKYATGWNEDGELNKIYADNNVVYLATEKVVVDGNVITATDPFAAHDFGAHIVEMLQNQQQWG